MSNELKTELETYEKKLPTLTEDEGRFILIHGDVVEGIYDSYPDAMKIGYEKFAMEPFLVKCISATEHIHYFTRDLVLDCPT